MAPHSVSNSGQHLGNTGTFVIPEKCALGELGRDLSRRYDVIQDEIAIGATHFLFSMVRDTNKLVDEIDPGTFAIDERLPYWAEIWSSSVGLAEHLLEDNALRGKTVLELGCGLGLAGITAARAGARVMLTDYEDDALRFAGYNAAMNLDAVACKEVTLKKMDWRIPEEIGFFDLVIGADIVYDRKDFPSLLNVVGKTLRRGGHAIFSDPGRVVAQEFVGLAQASGFRVDSRSRNVVMKQRTIKIVHHALRSLVQDSVDGGAG